MNDDREEAHPGAVGTASRDASAQPLALTAVGDRCVACGAPLSSDQRYCVDCGERRSKPRFSLPEEAAPATEVVTAPRRPPRRPRASAGGTLVAGVGTLLLAMGVGVLIGRTSHTSAAQTASPRVQVITVGGSSPASNAAASTAAPTTGKKSKSQSKSKSKANSKSKPSAATAAKASAAASKVLGGKSLPPATVTVGASGSGAGYQNGHFNGTFFGGG